MKTKITILAMAALLVCGFLCGCKSPELTAYKTLASIALTVNTAKHAYEDYRALGSVTPEQDAKIKAAYLQYQGAFKVAEDIQKSLAGNADKTLYMQLIQSVEAVSGDFLNLVAQFVPTFKRI